MTRTEINNLTASTLVPQIDISEDLFVRSAHLDYVDQQDNALYALITGSTANMSNYYTKSQSDTYLNSKAALSHTHAISDISGLSSALALKADLVGGLIPQSQLPSYVDDVLEYADLASFPATGETSKIYIALDTNFSYRWGGSVYVKIADGAPVSGSPNYIQNQNAAAQTSSNFWIDGSGKMNDLVLTGLSGSGQRMVVVDSTGQISAASAITANRALISDVNGLPIAATTTATELGYVNGVTSAIQTQLNTKLSTLTVNTTTITGGTTLRVAFNNAGVYSEAQDLRYDPTGRAIYIGSTTAPSNVTPLTILKDDSGTNSFLIMQGASGGLFEFADVGSSGLSPALKTVPSGNNGAYWLNQGSDVAGIPALTFSIRNAAGSAGLATRDLWKLQNYTTDVITAKANNDVTFTGNVGVNRTSPIDRLDVSGGIRGSGTGTLTALPNSFSLDNPAGFVRMNTFGPNSTVRGGFQIRQTSSTGVLPITSFVLDGDGKLGIGNTAPSALLTLGTAGTTAGSLSMAGATSGTVTIQAAAAAGTTTLTLPTAYAAANGYLLSSTTTGVLSWIAVPTVNVDATNSSTYTGSIGAGSATNSNFFGSSAGYAATGATYSNFFGYQAGYNATNANYSNFFGRYAGKGASDASDSLFFGDGAGQDATGANSSRFFGNGAGKNATNATASNFFGGAAGFNATDAYSSNFFGSSAGQSAANANYSNFYGYFAGYQATNASIANMYGLYAGYQATNAKNAIYIGESAGNEFELVSNKANNGANDYSILIGRYTRTGGFKNSIILGGAINTTYVSNTKNNQFMLAPNITDVRWRSVDYTLPSAQGAANTVLSNNGSGVLSWVASSRLLQSFYTDQNNVGSGVSTLYTYSLPANTLDANGKMLEIEFSGKYLTASSSVKFQIAIGSTTHVAQSFNITGDIVFKVKVIRTSASAYRMSIVESSTGYGTTSAIVTTGSADFTTGVTIDFQGNGTASDQLQGVMGHISLL